MTPHDPDDVVGDDEPQHAGSLRSLMMRGGVAMAGREMGGVVLRLAGILVLTRLLGPTDFGLYSGSFAIVGVLVMAAGLGVDIFLPRAEHEPSDRAYDEAFTAVLASSLAVVALVFAVVLAAGDWLLPHGDFRWPLLVMTLGIPITVLRLPARAKLERRFQWGRVAALELGGDAALYVVAVALAAAGLGVWAPVSGYFAWQLWALLSAHWFAGYRPRLRWSWARFRALSRYGFVFSTSTMLNRSEDVLNPIVVGASLGPRSVGLTAFAIRLGDTTAFPARASWRLALVALGRIQGDKSRLQRGIEETMSMQVLVLGVAFLALCLTAPAVVPALFGDQWKAAVPLLPFVAVRYVALGVNGAQESALYAMGAQRELLGLAALRALTAVVLAVALVPPFGLTGFGFALLAPLVSSAGFGVVVRRHGISVSYRTSLLWAVAFVPGCFSLLIDSPLGLLLVLTAVPALLTPLARGRLRGYAALVRARTASADQSA